MDNVHKKFSEIRSLLKGSKHVKLQDIHGKDIVPFNQPKKPIAPKITQIEQKLKTLPAGVYCVVAQDRFGANVHQDKFYYGKGKFDSTLNEGSPVNQNHQENRSGSDHVLSLESALEQIRTTSRLESENAVLKRENEDLKKRVLELENKCSTLEDANKQLAEEADMEEEEPNSFIKSIGSFLEPIAPMLPSIADRYFDLAKQKDETKRVQMLLENGYEIPGATRRAGASQSKKKADMPTPGTAEWDQYIDEVLDLDDAKFEQHLELVRTKFPSIYPDLEAAVYNEEENP